jgi:hypothetical protein
MGVKPGNESMIGVHHRWLKKYGSDHSPLLQFLLEIITQKFFIKSFDVSGGG